MDFWLKLEIVQVQRTTSLKGSMTFLEHHLTIYRLKAFKNKKVDTFCISIFVNIRVKVVKSDFGQSAQLTCSGSSSVSSSA